MTRKHNKASIADCNAVYKKHTGKDLNAFTNARTGNDSQGEVNRFTEEELYTLFSLYKAEKGWTTIPKAINGELVEVKTPVIITIAGFSIWLRSQGAIGLKSVRYYLSKYEELSAAINEELEEHTVSGTSTGQVNTSMGIFYLKNKCGYSDRIEQNITSDTSQTIQIINDLKED